MSLRIFISSTYSDNRDLRVRLAEALYAEGHRVLIAEDTRLIDGFVPKPLLDRPNAIEVSDLCLNELATCDAMVCVLSGAVGSSVQAQDQVFRAKHFELEVFSALLQAKPILLCALPSFKPDSETMGFIRCVGRSIPLQPAANAEELLTAALGFCASLQAATPQRQARDSSLPLTEGLAVLRASYDSIRSQKMLLPFLGDLRVEERRPDLDAARAALDSLPAEQDLHVKLSRLWVAVRELLPSSPHKTRDPQVLMAWDRLLSEWISTSSWYSLHTHVHLGAVAAATGLWTLRQKQDLPPSDTAPRKMPLGAVTSANYSLIQRIPNKAMRYLAFRSLLGFLDRHRGLEANQSNILLIRGSICLRLFNPIASAADFRAALHQLERAGATDSAIADAQVHLALPLALLLQRRNARRLIDEGLDHMRVNADAGSLLRALRKAIAIETKIPFGDRERAAALHQEAQALVASAPSYLDQVRHFDAH